MTPDDIPDIPDDQPPIPNGPKFVPYSVGHRLDHAINQDGGNIIMTVIMNMGPPDADIPPPTMCFIVDPESWYAFARDSLVTIATHLPDMRPKEWVEAPWLAEWAPG